MNLYETHSLVDQNSRGPPFLGEEITTKTENHPIYSFKVI